MKGKKGKNILIGVCAGIASYKVCYLVRKLIKQGHSVKVMMTPAAAEFIRPILFKELTGEPVYQEMFLSYGQKTQHIKLSEWTDLAVVAPLTANTLSKLALGICDNLLTTVICALGSQKPLLLVPSMNQRMWQNKIIKNNLGILRKIKNYEIILPEKGELACGSEGVGRMAEPEKIYQKIKILLKK